MNDLEIGDLVVFNKNVKSIQKFLNSGGEDGLYCIQNIGGKVKNGFNITAEHTKTKINYAFIEEELIRVTKVTHPEYFL